MRTFISHVERFFRDGGEVSRVDAAQALRIHGKLRALIGLMVETGRPTEAIKEVNQMSEEAAAVVQIRTRFAHGPLDMGIDFETREFKIYSRRVGLKGRQLTFQTLTDDELTATQAAVSKLYQQLMESWGLIVGEAAGVDALAPPHEGC